MGFSVNVGIFLCDEDDAHWPLAERHRFLDEINAALRRLGQPEHREPRSPADIDPPLPAGVNPCELGAAMGSYSSHGRRVDRLDWFARHIAVTGTAPTTDPPYDPALYHRYDELAERNRCFDHLLAACSEGIVILPRHLGLVLAESTSDGHTWFVSARRLRAEAVALGHVMRYADPDVSINPTTDWLTGTPVEDFSFASLDARIPDHFDAIQGWIQESDLCHRLLQSADDVLRTGALGLTG